MTFKTLLRACFVTIALVSFNVDAYTMLVYRLDVNGLVIDDFDDGVPGGWGNFGTWQDEPDTSFARLESPGVISPSNLVNNVSDEKTSINSLNVTGGTITSGSPFNALLTLDTTLPALDQTYFFALHNFDEASSADSTLIDTVVFGLINFSPELAELGGVTPGLTFAQYRLEYGPNLIVTNVTDLSYTSLLMPTTLDTIQLAIGYNQIGAVGQLTGSYRFDSNGGVISPLPAINTNLALGFWGIGTVHSTIVPLPAAFWLFGSGFLGIIGFARRKA